MSRPTVPTSELLSRAEAFIWKNARLLDRHLYAFQFQGGSRQPVLDTLRAYQNEDGGFGSALEPDLRCPDSQPVPVQHALELLDEVGWEEEMSGRACDFLMTITTKEGGVPFVLPSARRYPHAPWWSSDENPPAALNPTAALAGLLHKSGSRHHWLERATEFCWQKLTGYQSEEMHEMGAILTFLRSVPDRDRAAAEMERLGRHMLSSGLVADIDSVGYVRKPLDRAPTPNHPLRALFSEALIQGNLDELVTSQREDGGWSIAWEAISPACELEWRGWITRSALLTLRANGRLTSPSR